ncbi:hypothetical protein FEM48_Zijuj05G0051900 [Ziziphus jujuba var. spinosa]|uniref:Uncharacterized protein n=1 Tax=Ziziphus jujuba var. spinosa TaxID=714518 RepID=A0A978VD04_ZIZJJ|nr:hypothetical protein FEM48_Zijuj05G0051900 [Ziziphus jujuba var. spinosa]
MAPFWAVSLSPCSLLWRPKLVAVDSPPTGIDMSDQYEELLCMKFNSINFTPITDLPVESLYHMLLPFSRIIDEKPGDPWDLLRIAIYALGAAMRVAHPIVPVPETKRCLQPGLPWFPGHANET